jgi:hypothetical protein
MSLAVEELIAQLPRPEGYLEYGNDEDEVYEVDEVRFPYVLQAWAWATIRNKQWLVQDRTGEDTEASFDSANDVALTVAHDFPP